MKTRLNLFIICCVGFISYGGIGLVYPIFAALLFDPSANILPHDTSGEMRGFLFGLLIALTPIAQFFSSTIMGALSDRIGRKKVLEIGVGFGILGYFIATAGIQFGSIVLLLIYRLFIGISEGAAAVAQAAIADLSTEENKSRHFSLYNASLGIGFTLGPFFGGILSDPKVAAWCGYATPFILTGFVCALNWLLIYFKYPDSEKRQVEVKYNIFDGIYNLKRAFYWKGLRTLFLAAFAFAFGWVFYAEFIPITLMKTFNYSTSQVGEYFAYNGLWYALSTSFLTAPLLKYFGPEKIVTKVLFIAGLYLPLFMFIENPIYLWFFNPILMYLVAVIFPTMAAFVSNKADKDKQGEVMGIYQSVFAFAAGISPLFGGTLISTYPMLTVIGGGGAMLISGIIFWYGQKALSAKEEVAA